MKTMLWPVYLLFLALEGVLSACSPNATPTPYITPVEPTSMAEQTAKTGANCLTGSWQSADLSGYLRSVYGQGVARMAYFASTSGGYRLQFNADGSAALTADHFSVTTTGVLPNQRNIKSTTLANGTATASYRVDGSAITFSNINKSGFSSTGDGYPYFWPILEHPATYTCNGDTLTLIVTLDMPTPIIFHRGA